MSNKTDSLTRREFVKTSGLGGLALGLGTASTISGLFTKTGIVADDMGYSDLGCYGGEMPEFGTV